MANSRKSLPTEPKALRVGCIGGGQLGRMMALEAPRLNIQMSFLDPAGDDCPAAAAAGKQSITLKGGLNDESKLRELAANCDVVTCEIEHIGTEVLQKLESEGINVQPSGHVVKIIQDKYVQKEHFAKHGIPLPPYVDIPDIKSIHDAADKFGLPLMLKSRLGAYDGRGNSVLKEVSDEAISDALNSLGMDAEKAKNGGKLDLYAEGWINFHSEVAVMVVRSTTGETSAYPAVTAIQTDSICRVVLVPARGVPEALRHKCEDIASKAIDCLGNGASGVFGVELFIAEVNGQLDILLNEVAPRPHNTGHYTQDACAVSQFENHLRAVCGLPLGDTSLSVGASAMVNVLGAKSGTIEDTMRGSNAALAMPRATVHCYGKAGCRAGRKMGHINLTADSHGELDQALVKLLELEDISPSVIPGGLGKSPLVGIIMGSQSDLPAMQAAVEIMKEFDIPYEVDIVSAHRTPDKLCAYSRGAASKGLQVIIAGAGGAAHLPGMVAAMTPLPVVGVPIKTSTLNGQDSLLSIVQMPRGIPVATVAIGNAMNAGLLAVRCLCASRPELREKMELYQKTMKEKVDKMSASLIELGSDAFLDAMENKSTSVNV
uniref:phosphoribosylaminoimidazole carboxylase n=1 Tax=Chaetoceros debilis TaxID=122233 RepID=A0A7S3Q7C4_9STRA